MNELTKFKELGLSENVLKALSKKGFEEPTPIQELVIPKLLQGERDIVGQAQTGTGKTAAFGLPLIELLDDKSPFVQAIVLTPTRELALQVAEEMNSLKGKKRLNIVPIYGGQSMELQLRRLENDAHIVVGTPGRVIDHINRKTLRLNKLKFMVLDEADEMLNMGFIEDIEEIIKHTNEDKRMLLFSATMPKEILNIAKKYMKDYEVLAVKTKQLTTELTEQIYFQVREEDKFEALCRIRDMEKEFYGLIFCRTKVDVDTVCNRLIDRGYNAEALHGDISQYQRERILKRFKAKQINMLVATDVAARGIDISDLTHVINYSLPQDPESYVHRIGRTGRAGKEGTAITFVTPEEYRKLLYIMKIAKADIKKKKVPSVSEVIQAKKERIKDEVSDILSDNMSNDYFELANKLLEEYDPVKIVAALLKMNYKDDFEAGSYSEISEVSNVDRKGKARLFIAMGKLENMTPKKIVDFIVDKTGIKESDIKEVKVFDKFSFISVPYEDATYIVNIFKKQNRGKRPLVEIAKEAKK